MTAGRYAVTLDYTCPQADAGSVVELNFNGAPLGTVKVDLRRLTLILLE